MARLVVDGGHPLAQALQRAARAQRLNPRRPAPSLTALRAAVRDYRELFRPEQSALLHQQRRLALQAMQALADLEPRLGGSLVHGDGPLDTIRLFVVADTPEDVLLRLTDQRIPWRPEEVELCHSGGRRVRRPAARFLAGDTTVEVIILPPSGRSDPPRDTISGGPIEMLRLAELEALLASPDPDQRDWIGT